MDPNQFDKNKVEQTTYLADTLRYPGVREQRGEFVSDEQGPIHVGAANSTTREGGHIYRHWQLEILAGFLSVVSLVVIIVVLWIEDGRALEDWRWRIGPTAVISFISTISKSALLVVINSAIGQLKWHNFYGRTNSLFDMQLFDDSGRGVVGAAMLIWHKNRKAVLASLAAFIVIASLLVDPFVQLALNFTTASRLIPGESGGVQKTEVYDPVGNIHDNFFTAYGASAVNAQMQSAIIKTVSEPPSPLAASCSTGNCTWSEVSTLAICSQCSDVTTQVQVSCPSQGRIHQCFYNFPSGNNISGRAFEAGHTAQFFLTLWNSTASTGYDSLADAGKPADLVNFDAVQLKGKFDSDNFDFDSVLAHPTAYTCQMRFCAKTYESIVMENGVVSASRPRVTKLFQTGVGSTFNNKNGLSLLRHLREEGADDTDYRVNEADYSNTAEYLTEVFSTGWSMSGFRADNSVSGATAPNLGFRFADVPDFPAKIWDIAESMTEVIRTSHNSTVVSVQASLSRTYISVQYAWLALPIALTALSLGLVAWVIIATHREGIPTLRNSNLALLAFHVDGWTSGQLIARGEGALANEAKGVHVTLPKESGGTSFARVE